MKPVLLIRRLLILSLLAPPAQAKVIQILHTNDLHASLSTAGAPKGTTAELGSWARVKYILDDLTDQAKAKGMETIRLDAGDFYEGTIDYFPNFGKGVLKTFQDMDYDAVTMGNHDWLMGAQSMNSAFGDLPFPFPMLCANVRISHRMKNLREQIKPSIQIVRDGIKIGVLGLSTHEALYKWITQVDSFKRDLTVLDYEDEDTDENWGTPGIANRAIAELRENNDVVIALTHIGFDADQELAAASKGLDLIIGGHSHTLLESMNMVPDTEGKVVPIVQTGVNGKYVGKILIDVVEGQRPKVLSYELIPVLKNGPVDPIIQADVEEAKKSVDELYGKARLDEVIGRSEVRLLSGDSGPTAYSKFIVDAMKDVTGAELGLDIGAFHGNTPQPAGDVTRKMLMEMYPRKFEAARNEGLYVYRTLIPGWVLDLGLRYAVKWGYFVSFSGVTFDLYKLPEEQFEKEKIRLKEKDRNQLTPYRIKNLQFNGERVCLHCSYDVAVPESFIRGAYGISPLTKLIVRRARKTDYTIWQASEAYLKKIGVIQKLRPDEHFSAKEFSNGFKSRYEMESIHEQFNSQDNDGEGFEVPWHNSIESFQMGLDGFLDEMKKGPQEPDPLDGSLDNDADTSSGSK